MQPKSQLEKLREKIRNAAIPGKIVWIDAEQFSHFHGKERILYRFNARRNETDFECDCGLIFRRR